MRCCADDTCCCVSSGAHPIIHYHLAPVYYTSWRAQDGEEEDALDAFMAAEILPEVTAAQQAERAAKEQERLERAKALAVRAAPPSEQASKLVSEPSAYVQQRAHMLPAHGAIMDCAAPHRRSTAYDETCQSLMMIYPAETGGQAGKHSQARQDSRRGLRRGGARPGAADPGAQGEPFMLLCRPLHRRVHCNCNSSYP